ncbi:MAG: PQQ-like beta-propeller repeat protein [Bacteroidales bacterium]|nr:PQQ-like beta-propeller repeat protein [Bacteroidales bacterium]MCF8455066.1 PQQ-like beta-propeller repeat protein [Bacteroidales bacterium]
MKKTTIASLTVAFVLISLFSCNQGPKNIKGDNDNSISKEDKVYEWRGENRKGIYNESGLLKAWPEAGPELVWEYEGIGNGYGSPVFTPDKMYILGEVDSLAYLFAFDLNGTLLWKKDFGKEWVKNYNGSRSTPTIVGDLIYVTSGLGNVYCLDRNSGEKIWSVDMINDLHGTYPLFGYSESVIVEDEKVFCTPGGKDTNVVALDRFSGEILWISKGAGERPGYNSPQIIKLNDRNVLVNFTAYQLMGHDTKTGELLWVHNQDNIPVDKRQPGNGDTHSNTIIYDDGFIYYAAGDGNCGVKLELSNDGKSIKEVWRNPDFDSYMGGIVKIGDHLYGCGSAKREIKSINAGSGEIENILKVGSGAVIAADNMLYYYNFKGEVMLITSNPLNMEVVGKFRIDKGANEHFAHPVINDGKMYVRHGNVIQAFYLKG